MSLAQRAITLRRRLFIRLAERDAQRGRLPEALQRLSRAAASEDLSIRAAALDSAATLAERHGRLAQSAEYLRDLLRTDDSNLATWRRLALLLEEIGETAEAAYAWRRRLAGMGEDEAVRLRIARLVEIFGDADQIAEAWSEVLLAAPDNRLALGRIADLLELPAPQRATSFARRAVAGGAPGWNEPRLAQLLDRAGERDEAIRLWTQVRSLARQGGDLGLQHQALDALLALAPDDVEVRFAHAERLIDAGRTWEALAHLEIAIAADPAQRSHLQTYAEAMEACGLNEKAITAWSALADLAPNDDLLQEQVAARLDALGAVAQAAPLLLRVATAREKDRKAWLRVSKRARDLGDTAGELVATERLLGFKPNDIAARRRLIDLLLSAKRHPEAEPHLEVLVRLEPEEASHLRTLASVKESLGDLPSALSALRRVSELEPGDDELHEHLVKVLDRQADRRGALVHLEALARTAPTVAMHWRRLADRLEEFDQMERAVDALQRLAALEPDHNGHVDRIAKGLITLGRDEEALPWAWRVTRAFPGDLDRWRALGSFLERTGRAADAAQAWIHVALAAPSDADAEAALARLGRNISPLAAGEENARIVLTLLSEAYRRMGRKVEAAEMLRRLSLMSPQDADLLERLALAYALLKDADKVQEALSQAKLLRPITLETMRRLALIQADNDDNNAAIESWRILLEALPDDLEAHQRAGAILYGQQRRDEALPHLRAVVAQLPNDVRTWRRIASIVAASDDDIAKVAAWRDVVAAAPDDLGAHEELIKLLEDADVQAALPHMQAAAELTPDKVKPWKRLAKWLQDLDRVDESIAAWSQSLAIAPDDVETHRRLAQLYLLQGDYKAGLKHMDCFARLTEEAPPATQAIAPAAPRSTTLPLISAVILSLEGAELLDSLLESFHRTNTYPAVELIVIDHGSKDRTADVLDAWQDRLPIRRVMRDGNYSYSASCNLGVSEARGDLVLLLNNDVVFHEDVLGEMARYLTEDVGIVGLKQYNSAPLPEELLRAYHIGVRFVWDAAEGWFKPRHVVPTPTDQLLGKQAAYFPAVTASIMLCRKRDYIALGGLDEHYVYGHEDVDFCCRMRLDHGKRIISLNSRSAFHRKNSTRRSEDAVALQAQRAANQALFRERWADRIAAECLEHTFTDDGSWRGVAPTVALGLPAAADQAAAASLLHLGEAITTLNGWQVRYLLEGEQGWNDGRSLDAVLALPGFPIGKLRKASPHLLKVALGESAEAAAPHGYDKAVVFGVGGSMAASKALVISLRELQVQPAPPKVRAA